MEASMFFRSFQKLFQFRHGLSRARSVLLLVLAFSLAAAGCQGTTKSVRSELDPARRALGEASIKVMAEKLESPDRRLGRSGVLSWSYVFSGEFVGEASEAVRALSAAMGYGFLLADADAGQKEVVVKSTGQERPTVGDLLKDLNRQLKPHQAFLGLDVVNRRLVLTATEAPDGQ
jgi:hypothetical protein